MENGRTHGRARKALRVACVGIMTGNLCVFLVRLGNVSGQDLVKQLKWELRRCGMSMVCESKPITAVEILGGEVRNGRGRLPRVSGESEGSKARPASPSSVT